MTKQQRRSIISSFSALTAPASLDAETGLASGQAEQERDMRSTGPVTPGSAATPVPRVGAGVIGATQRTLTDIREERDRLLAQVEAGGWLEVDPAFIDPSPFPDRLPDDDATAFAALKQTMAEDGQKVPVELRRHPEKPGRFQIVYGHRRWRAALELGIKLKAFVADLSDREMVIAQGIENATRQDLTWIEKALFVHQMDEAGIKARDIRAALVVDDSEINRFRTVCRTLGVDIIRLIGRAPKAGRPRWGDLAAAVSADAELLPRIRKTLAGAKVLSSDARFAACLGLPQIHLERSARHKVTLSGLSGQTLGTVAFAADGFRVRLDKTQAEAFIAFFQDELPDLTRRFLSEQERH